MDKEKVEKLASLSRIEISDKEAEDLAHEFESILKYVSDIKDVVGGEDKEISKAESYSVRNIMREDENPHESGIYTENILDQAPERQGQYIKVKKIL